MRDGFTVARRTVERLMRQAGLRGVVRGKSPRTTRPAPRPTGPPTWLSGSSPPPPPTSFGSRTSLTPAPPPGPRNAPWTASPRTPV
ncbi:transposase [Streptomyces sp. NPDC005794]|uniref:transposase n=1 Tax=Streptomyces sp. NPDC005794 TaxID=3364733 RepID=UPI00367AD421